MRVLPVAILAVAVAIGAARTAGLDGALAGGDLVAGLALLGSGGLVWAWGLGNRVAALMMVAGATWFAGDVWPTLLYLHRGPFVHLVLAYPRGRLSSRTAAAVTAAAYVDGAVFALARSDRVTIVLMTAVIAVAAVRHRGARWAERRARLAALGAAFAVGGVLAVAAATRLAGHDVDMAALWSYDVAVAVVAVGLLVDLRWGRWTRAAVTGLVLDLGELERPESLGARLGRALGDPNLVVGYPLAGGTSYIDERGLALAMPATDSGRTLTVIDDAGEPIAAIVHDAAVLDDPVLVAAVASTARFAFCNARLEADVQARVREVDASRGRIVAVGDAQRRRLEHDLRRGPQRRIAAVRARNDRVASNGDATTGGPLEELAGDVRRVRDELDRFAAGLHPATLTDVGLRAALGELAARSPLPVSIDVLADVERFPPAVEAGAYFLCAEALTNVAKYAEASHAYVRVERRGDSVQVAVDDDGCGGAHAAGGTGLRGLADRIEALGGRMSVESPRGGGTRVAAWIPLGVR
jgi:signal transduction histidine kinase